MWLGGDPAAREGTIHVLLPVTKLPHPNIFDSKKFFRTLHSFFFLIGQTALGATTGDMEILIINFHLRGICLKYLVAKIHNMRKIGFQCIALIVINIDIRLCHL